MAQPRVCRSLVSLRTTKILGSSAAAILLCAAVLTACGGDDEKKTPTAVDIAQLDTLVSAPPLGFTGRKIALDGRDIDSAVAQPLPPGYQINPSHCAPKPVTPAPGDSSATVVLTSEATVVVATAVVLAVPAAEPSQGCEQMTVSGPNGTAGIIARTESDAIDGVEKIWSTHGVVSADDVTADQYTYVAQIDDRHQIIILQNPNPRSTGSAERLDPSVGRQVLEKAVQAVITR